MKLSLLTSTASAALVGLAGANVPTLDVEYAGVQEETGLMAVENAEVRNARNLAAADGPFAALGCNSDLATACASPTLISDLLAGGSPSATQPLVVQCGECVLVDNPADMTDLTIGGLDVIGKLIFDSASTNPITIHTPYVFVQGELEITSTAAASPDNRLVSFVLTGADSVDFAPHADNASSCTGGSCDVGAKPFLVAGGRLNISTVPETCPTWTKLMKIDRGDKEFLGEGQYETVVTAPPECPSPILMDHTFTQPDDATLGWTGGLGATATVDLAEHDLQVTDRKETLRGPHLDMTPHVDCLVPGVEYLFTAKVRLTKGSETGPTTCASGGGNCLKFHSKVKYANKSTSERTFQQRSYQSGNYGEWNEFIGTYKYTQNDLSPDVIYHLLYVDGPEPGVEIDVEEVTLGLPDETSYPDPDDVCHELILNGDAEGNGMHVHPFITTDQSATFLTKLSEDDGGIGGENKFYRHLGRTFQWQGIRQDLNRNCIKANLVYTVSLKIRMGSPAGTKVGTYAEIKSFDLPDRKGEFYNTALNCDPQDEADGWVECSGDFMFDQRMEDATEHEFRVKTTGGQAVTPIDTDDIRITFKDGPVRGLVVDSAVAECWGDGSDVIVTSHTLDYEDGQERVIESVTDHGDGTATVALTDSIIPPTSLEDSADFAVEVGLLTRNVVIEGSEVDRDNLLGGYLTFFYTEGVEQLLNGVDFRYMGQNPVQDRFPIHLKMCGDASNTIISKNTIRDSFQRGVVVQGTQSATISDNVAYNNKGHVFLLQDGSEYDNTFTRNLGALTDELAEPISGDDFHDDHDYPTVFFCFNPNNHWIDNIAAGSEYSGWRFDLQSSVKGESASEYSIDVREEPIGSFIGNEAHSNRYYGMYMEDMEQKTVNSFVGLKVYRNKREGIWFRACRHLAITGGVFADNRIQLFFDQTDAFTLTGAIIRGETELYRNLLLTQDVDKLCPSSTPVLGVKMPTYLRYTSSGTGTFRGGTLSNLQFSDFDATSCTTATPIYFDDARRDNHFDHITSATNIAIDDSRSKSVDVCSAHSRDVDDVLITDTDSSLNPDEASTFTGTSVLVSNKPQMTTFLPEKCVNYDDQCFSYCEDACLRTVAFFADPFGTEDLVLHIEDANDASVYIDVEGHRQTSSNIKYIHDLYRQRRFPASLPGGRSYVAEFRNPDGTIAWPLYTTEVWEHEPECEGHANAGDITLTIPEPEPTACDELIRNGDIDDGTLNPWLQNGGDIQFMAGGGIDGTDAIASKARTRTYHGIGQYLDSRCLAANVGKQYEIKAWIKVVQGDMVTPVDCDENQVSSEGGCPIISFRENYYDNAETKTKLKQSYPMMAEVVRNYNEDGFRLIHGVFTIDAKLAGRSNAWLYVEEFDKTWEVIVSKMSVTPLEDPVARENGSWCDEIVLNGDVKMGGTIYYDTYPSQYSKDGPFLEIVTGVDGESDSAIKTYGREATNSSPRQDAKLECLIAGERYVARAKYKLEEDNAPFQCSPFMSTSATRCPEMRLRSHIDGTGSDTSMLIGEAAAPTSADSWNSIAGVFTATEHQATAEKLYFYFEDEATSLDITVDDMTITHLPLDCSNLIPDPTFDSGVAEFWKTDSSSNSMVGVHSPGFGGSAFALRSYDRTANSRGLRLNLDSRCFNAGDEYIIKAQLRLIDANGDGADCNKYVSSGDSENCPAVKIYATGCPDGGSVSVRKWNENFIPWNADSYNAFEAEFEVDTYLASCTDTRVYIEDVNKAWDIIVDDFNIVPKTTGVATSSPTKAWTASPTVAPVVQDPTMEPTVAPTEVAIVCPPVDAAPIAVGSGRQFFQVAGANELCTLTRRTTDPTTGETTSVVPVARSYDENEWEHAAGEFVADELVGEDWRCYSGGSCRFDLPVIDPATSPNDEYVLRSYSHSLQERDEVARFLESTTFGTRKSDLDGWSTTMTDWVKDQIEVVQMTSHREFWRKRANPRWLYAHPAGRPDHPCEAHSHWRKYTFTKKDRDKDEKEMFLETEPVNPAGGPPYKLIVDGHVRAVVNEMRFRDASVPFDYEWVHEICNYPYPPSARFNRGRLYLRTESFGCEEVDRSIGNPAVDFTGFEQLAPYVLQLDPNNLVTFSEEVEVYPVLPGEDLMLTSGLSDPLCNSLPEVIEEEDPPIYGRLPDGTWLRYDPRLRFLTNTLSDPIPDGGGATAIATADATLCSNVPRTFLNIDDCVLSHEASACGSAPAPDTSISLDDANILMLHDLTGRYVYAILGLPVRDNDDNVIEHPCTPGLVSRWEFSDAPCDDATNLQPETTFELQQLLNVSSDPNPFINDIEFPESGANCNPSDTDPEIQIQIGSICWTRVHPEHLSVYDMTYWTRDDTHPGNAYAASQNHSHPIKKWADIDGSAKLIFPSTHPVDPSFNHDLGRWDVHHVKFKKVGRYGDSIRFRDLPNELRNAEVAQHYNVTGSTGGDGVLVCGSPNEISNDPDYQSVFDVTSDDDRDTSSTSVFKNAREIVWSNVVMTAEDQLRQRMAWALSQILVVATGAIETQDRNSEIFLSYYDIFVRHAFGNYRDVLKEISYSPMMAENLSFLQSKSAAYVWDRERVRTHADENFAREIMQLFSCGLYKLNLDGTPKLDADGSTPQVYTNDDIMSFARAWTGFTGQQNRGNTEDYEDDWNKVDPMRIEAEWRDRFPKTSLKGGYIGDGYPLCVDLPDKMFLKTGARYRLLGSSSLPELMEDNFEFKSDPTIKRLELHSSGSSELYDALKCKDDGSGKCVFSNQVVLDSNLGCTTGPECLVETVRVVQVAENVFYEYVRPACVEQAFFNNAMKLSRQKRTWSKTMCGNPLLPVASEACCPDPLPLTSIIAIRNNVYDGERMTFAEAERRCQDLTPARKSCDFDEIDTDMYEEHKTGYHWADDPCEIQIRIDGDGNVAIMYEMQYYSSRVRHVDHETRNHFPVFWENDAYPKKTSSSDSCGECEEIEDGCLCKTRVTETLGFRSTKLPKSKEEVLSTLYVGAVDPSVYGTYTSTSLNDIDVTVHTIGGAYDRNTIFEVTDDVGRTHFLKNSLSAVEILGIYGDPTLFSFRNAPHFMSLIPTETNARDAMYETEAVLDDYFYHDNTPPFLAIRFIQRFGISNPSPRYVKAVATAFREGTYLSDSGETFGGNVYGDLAATAAAVVLDREARTPVLDADPSHGSLREPILKVIAVFRSMEYETQSGHSLVEFDKMDEIIGQMAHELPSVFSFFRPEYVPDGRLTSARLVSPESMLYDMPNIVGIVNGLFALYKYGLCECNGGFGWSDGTGSCRDDGTYERARAILEYQSPGSDTAAIIDDLSTLLTSGRLSDDNKRIIQEAHDAEVLAEGDAGAGFRLAQQLIAATPEFHSTNLVEKSGLARGEIESEPRDENLPYKATVFLMFTGGCDSYNMLIPHTCTPAANKTDLAEQYRDVRQQVALTTGLHEIDAVNQPCDKFGVHPNLGILQELYDQGDALFFANTGVLTAPVTKDNYREVTETELFAHNTMQRAARRVDPFNAIRGTGVMGRMADVLTSKSIKTQSISIDKSTVTLVGEPGVSPAYNIIDKDGVDEFNPAPSAADMREVIADLNNASTVDSGFFAETWSSKFLLSLDQNEQVHEALNAATTETAFPDTSLGDRLKLITQMMQTYEQREVNRDLYYVEMGGYDTHAEVVDNLIENFSEVDGALRAFITELQRLQLWENVALIQTSDFARTLTPNGGDGTDHAWGGNYFMLGGSVKGSQILGEFPDDITDDAPLRLSRGRLVPTTSWDMIWNGLSQWMDITGVDELDRVCPNRNNFPPESLLDVTDLFDGMLPDTRRTRDRKRFLRK